MQADLCIKLRQIYIFFPIQYRLRVFFKDVLILPTESRRRSLRSQPVLSENLRQQLGRLYGLTVVHLILKKRELSLLLITFHRLYLILGHKRIVACSNINVFLDIALGRGKEGKKGKNWQPFRHLSKIIVGNGVLDHAGCDLRSGSTFISHGE